MTRKTARRAALPCTAALLSTALATGCIAEGETLPSAAQVRPFIQSRDAVAQQYWIAEQAVARAPVGFPLRFGAAVGRFTACGANGEQYGISVIWDWAGKQGADAAAQVQDAVPAIDRALADAGWTLSAPAAGSGPGVIGMTRQGITLSLNADPANPAPQENDWRPAESYDLTGPCLPATTPIANQLKTSNWTGDSYGTTPAPLAPLQLRTSG
jgi:hypothetical protein